jgi:spoIIIJ-associated protein
MIRIEADTLEEAYSKAAAELSCSVTQILFEVVQNPSSGFLGMFKKSAIINAKREGESEHKEEKPRKSRNNRRNKNRKKETPSEQLNKPQEKEKQKPVPQKKKQETSKKPQKRREERKEVAKTVEKPAERPAFKREKLKPKVEVGVAVEEIRKDINSLFTHSCFALEEIKVEAHNEDTVLIEFSGEDAALLIGKEGYRYKSLSYLLYNWINIKYNLNVRLEIAEFLKNQEEMISKYLVGVIERINNTGRAQTKILDGVLVKIALEALRKEFPNKYVGIKSGREGGRFIVINDFNRKASQ